MRTESSETPVRSASRCPYSLRRTGSCSFWSIGSASATAADCPSTLVRSWRSTVRRTMYSTIGRAAFAASRTWSAPVLRHELRRIQPVRHDHHDGLHRVLLLERERPLGRARARLVGVERQHRARREPRHQPEVRLAQRGPARRDRAVDPGLREPDHVRVALDHEHLAGARDRLPRPVEVVEDLALPVDRRLRGVEVLGHLAGARVAREDPRPEPQVAPLQVLDRERQPPAEPVADHAVLALGREPGLEQHVGAEILRQAPQAGSPDSRARSRSRTPSSDSADSPRSWT